MPIMGFEKHPMERFSALLVVMDEEGSNNLKINVVQPNEIEHMHRRYIAVKCSRFLTMFRVDEIDKLKKAGDQVDSLTGPAHTLMAGLISARDHAREEMETDPRAREKRQEKEALIA